MSFGTHGTAPVTEWASDPIAAPDGKAWDLLIVGGGTAGLVAAHTAAGFGATVLLVERKLTGGDCLWTGCVPSKSLLAAAHAAAEAREASALGVHVGQVDVDFAAVMAHVRAAISTIAPVDSPDALRQAGAHVARGTATFTGRDTAEIDGQPVRFRQALLATGSSPLVPGIPGLADADPLTSDTVWQLDRLPETLLVLGGGAIGCELGQGLARLGSRVTIVEAEDRLLSKESAAASAMLETTFRNDGIDVRVGVAVTEVEPAGGSGHGAGHRVHLADGSSIVAEHLLVAIGRRPGTAHLGLEAAGVDLQDSGHVVVDARLRTTNPRIWAAGDLTGHAPFTHTAGTHGSLAASNAILGLRRTVKPDLVPRVTYTQPEVAAFGVAVDDDRPGLSVRTVPHTEVDRAVAEGRTGGHSTLVLDRKGRVVGASVVGPRAGESLAEAVLAGQLGAKGRSVAGAMHAYPTWSDGVWKAGLAQARSDLEAPLPQRATRLLAAVRRRWMSRG